MGLTATSANLTGTAEDAAILKGLHSVRTSAGWAPLPETGWIAVTGGDRVRWLNGMVTNSVQALTPGEGCYSFLLNAQGRIQGDGTIWCETERLLIETDKAQVGPMMTLLDWFIIMDDVELQHSSAGWHGLQIAGPKAADILTLLGLPARNSRLLKRTVVQWQRFDLHLITAYSPLVPRFEVWSNDPQAASAFRSELASSAKECSADDFEELRILEGTPLYGTDIRDRDLPQETAQTRALHFNKGCYLGQEIVERIRSRGQVHRTFTAFTLHGETPQPGTDLLADGKPVGTLTSVSRGHHDGGFVALGYVRREAVERSAMLTYAGGTAEAHLPGNASKSDTGT